MLPADLAWRLLLAAGLGVSAVIPFRIVPGGQQTASPLPSGPLSFGAFTARSLRRCCL